VLNVTVGVTVLYVVAGGGAFKNMSRLKGEGVRRGVTKCDRGGGVLHCVMSRLWNFFNL